ncbi:MAG: hypothetical protein AABW88_00135, partial [Nanoarchaeota archaeon]
ERLKLSFTDPDKIRELEQRIGPRGKTEIGDLADLVGGIPAVAGGILGGLGGTVGGFGIGAVPGAAIGFGAGEAVRQSIGGLIRSFTESLSPQEQKDIIVNKLVLRPLKTTAYTYVGGRVIGYMASRFPKLLGILTGETSEVIKEALNDPKVADLGLKTGDEALRNAVKIGGEQAIKLRDSFIKSFQEAFKKLTGKNADKLVKRSNLWNEFEAILESKGIKITGNLDNPLDFSISKVKANPGEITKIKDVYEALRNWTDFSLQGVVQLKQLVGALTKFANEAGGASKSPILGAYYHTIDNLIKTNLTKTQRGIYSQMNNIFSKHIDLFDEMVDAFNSGDPFARVANALGRNKDSLRQVLKFYEKMSGEKVLPIIAGREIAAEKTSGGLLGTGLGFRNFLDFFWSPSSQARTVIFAGRAIKPVEKGYQKVQEFVGKNIMRLK